MEILAMRDGFTLVVVLPRQFGILKVHLTGNGLDDGVIFVAAHFDVPPVPINNGIKTHGYASSSERGNPVFRVDEYPTRQPTNITLRSGNLALQESRPLQWGAASRSRTPGGVP
jgi:hypothetical protein